MRRMIQQVTTIALGGVLAAVLVMFPVTVATATTKNWISSTGDWSDGANWSGGIAPGINDIAVIAPNDGVARTINFDSSSILTALYVDLAGPGTAASTFSMPNNSDLTVHNIWAGGWNGAVPTTGRGVIDQSTGIVSITPGAGPFDILDLGVYSGSTGTYNLSGGTLQANAHEYVGDVGTGFFNHTGGTNSISGIGHNLYIGGGPNNGVGTYTISNSGSLLATVADVIVGNTSTGTGTLTIQNQASVDILNNLTINSHGTVNLNGGTLRFNGFSRAAGGIVNYTAGAVQLAGARNFNTDPAIIAFFGSGPTIPSGKALITEGTARINFFGTTVNGGTLSSLSSIEIADSGRLTITGGGTVSNVAGGFVGGVSTSLGEVVVSGAGSTWNNMENLRVGVPGSLNPGRSFLTINDGATVFVAQTLSIVDQSNVNLQGGTIRFDGYSREATSHFNFVRGTVQLAGNRTIGTDAAITDSLGAVPTLGTGKGLTIEGAANVQSPVVIGGGKLKTNSLAVSGNGALLFDRGILEIAGGAITGLPSLVVPANGEFRVSGIQTIQVTGAAGSLITATADLTLGNAALANAFYTNGALDVGTHAVTLADANDAVFDSAALVTLGAGGSPGTLAAANGLTLDFGGNVTGYGTVSTPNNVAKPLINNGHITGNSGAQPITLTGYVKGVGTFGNVNFTGTFSPGLSPTILTVGNIAFSPSSKLVMELGGPSPGSGYDQILSSAKLAFDGILQVSLINGFSPAAGQSFNLFDWASMSGTFNALQLPTLAGTLAWNTSQLYTTGMLSVVSPGVLGDYNNNGVVDAADYVLWRKNNNTAVTLPNDSTPGTDPSDYAVWRAHFGQTAGSGSGASANAAVPEPATALMIIVGLVVMCFRLRTAVS